MWPSAYALFHLRMRTVLIGKQILFVHRSHINVLFLYECTVNRWSCILATLSHDRDIKHTCVCDTYNHQICIFDSSGKLLHSFGTQWKSPGQFNVPYGIAIDKNGLLYVSDHNNGRVQIF